MATIKEVAKLAGVSPSTVSRVFSGNAAVTNEKRKKVEQVAKKLSYSPNSIAKSLKLGKSDTIGLLIPNIDNMVYTEIVRGAESYAKKNGYTIILGNTDEDKETEESYIRILKDKLVDGLVVATYTSESEYLDKLRQDNFPIVLVLRYINKLFDTVAVDNFRWAYNAVNYLIGLGHRKIAYASGTTKLVLYHQRMQGYKKALEDNNIGFDPGLIVPDQIKEKDLVRESAIRLLKKNPDIDAFFASNDYRAISIMHAINELGLSVPEDISVMGFDDVNISSLVVPSLTTIHQPLFKIGVRAAQRLIEIIEKKEPSEPTFDIIDAKIVERNSTGPKKNLAR